MSNGKLVAPSVGTSTWHTRVPYSDTDQGQIVHHSAYVRYLEQARIEHMRSRGLSYAALERAGKLALPVIEAQLRYRASARFDDQLETTTWVGLLNRAKLRFDSQIRLDGKLLTEAQITLACIRLPEGRIVSMPQEIWAAIGQDLTPGS